MNNIQLYINDQLVDLSDDNPIALTFQINNLAEVQNQQGNTSNQFKLPLTQRNRRILGYPDDIAFCTNDPYTQYDARFVQDGLEIIPYGIAELNSIDQDTASITVLSGNVDFFDAIDGKLYDMGDSTSQWTDMGKLLVWQPYDHEWNLENMARFQNKTEGWIWPVVDYGALTDDFSQAIDVRNQRPGFFVHTAVELLAQSAGYKINPDCFLLQQDLYQKLIVQFANDSFDHGTNFQNQPDVFGMYATRQYTQTFDHFNAKNPKNTLSFDTRISDPANQFNGTTFTVKTPGSYNVTVNVPKLYFDGHVAGNNPSYMKIYIVQTSGGALNIPTEVRFDLTQAFNRDPGTSGGGLRGNQTFNNTTMSQDLDLDTGDTVAVWYEFFNDTPESFILYPGASLVIKSLLTGVQFGQQIQCERIFPDIAEKDFLKDILQRFAIVCQTNNATKTISFNSFRDILNNIPLAIDWTSKCLNQGKSVSFQLGNYAQVNYMRCKEDDGVLPNQFADDHIDVADATLQATTDLFDSQFAPTLNRPFYGGTIAQILKIDQNSNSNNMSIGTSPRLLVDQKYALNGQNVTFTDGASSVVVNDMISVPYFYKPDGQYNLCFNDQPSTGAAPLPGLRKMYYPELQKILTQAKKVVRYFVLTPRDILELDLLIPVYLQQDNCYYYINKIDSWRKGQTTKVELVKIG